LRGDPEIMVLFEAATREVVAVGKAKGIKLPEDAAERNMSFLAGAPPTMMASMAHDLIRGNRIELPWLSGKVVSMGRDLGVPTPVHATLHAVLKLYTDGVGR
jgi:2-dehydropantoate 2-reductase